jgi:limonene-1,2-epoxide hydrolase
MTPEEVVRELCRLVSERDAELLRPLLAEDCIYHNVAIMEPNVGREACLANLAEQFANVQSYAYEIRNLVADGELVLTERIDMISGDDFTAPVPVMGTFEIADGQIRRWRDYWDLGSVKEMRAGEYLGTRLPD